MLNKTAKEMLSNEKLSKVTKKIGEIEEKHHDLEEMVKESV